MSLAYVNVCTGICYKFAGPNYIKLVKRLEKKHAFSRDQNLNLTEADLS